MYYTIYKVTNLLNNKIYIGAHKTYDLKDEYMGSGTYIKNAVKKYGIENFSKEIIDFCANEDEMYIVEKEIVNEKFVNRTDTYNLKEGGTSSFRDINKRGLNLYGGNAKNLDKYARPKSIERCKYLRKNDNEWVEKTNKAISKGMKSFFENDGVNGFKDKHHSEETKRKIGEANSKHQSGTGNSQFGTMWIYNLEEKLSKKIKKDEFTAYEKLGWLKGRKMKFTNN